MRKIYWFLGLGLALWAFGAMADDKANEEALLKRAGVYWESWRINDRQTAYKMETATVDGRLTPDEFKSPIGPRMRLMGYKLRDVKIQGDTAWMVVDLELTLPDLAGKGFGAPPMPEQWTLIKGEWFHGGHQQPAKDSKKSESGSPAKP